MAYCVFSATANPNERKEVEETYGSGLQTYWYKLNEICMELRKYYKPVGSSRKEIVTTLNHVYASDINLNFDFLSLPTETETLSMQESCSPSMECEETVPADSSDYDMDWL